MSLTYPIEGPAYQLYQRPGTKNWHIRFSIEGEGQIRKSLGTDQRPIAEIKAREIFYEAQARVRIGHKVKTRTFEQVATEFIENIHTKVARGELKPYHGIKSPATIQRYFIPYLGKKAIETISTTDIERYMEWRKGYWITGTGSTQDTIIYERKGKKLRRPTLKKVPKHGTLNSEAVLLRQLFAQAKRWGYLHNGQNIEVSITRATPNPRPSFSLEEFDRLRKLANDRILDPSINAHVRRDRAVLEAFISIAAFTGMRPTELLNLNWGDVLFYRTLESGPIGELHRKVRFRVHGKGKQREFIPHECAIPPLGVLWDLWKHTHGGKPPMDSDPVFATANGKRQGSFSKSLTELLKAAKLLTDHRGIRRVAYSFRHFYISQQIKNGVDVFLLAKNTGTSPEMIRKFYADVSLETMEDKIRPTWTR